jgi:glycosyltransferase involved in cell wall biosynthesis
MDLLYLSAAEIPSRSTNSMQTMRMCSAFASSGSDVTLVTLRHRIPKPEGFNGDVYSFYGVSQNFEQLSLPSLSGLGFDGYGRLYRVARVVPYSAYMGVRSGPFRAPFLCYGRSMVGLWTAVRARRLWGKRSAIRRIGAEMHDLPRDRWASRLLEEADVVFAISAALRDDLVAAVPSLEGRIWVEHDGADLDLHGSGGDREAARAALGLGGADGPLVVYTGRANEGKGIPVLLEAARHLERIGARVMVVGKVYDEQFRVQAPPNVTFTGFVPPAQIPPYLAAADALVLPTTADLRYAAYTSPLKLFEYMAARRPVVASNLPVLREVLQDESNALLYPPKEPAALAAAVERLWREPRLADSIAAQAERDVEQYSWDNRARRILSVMT